MKQLILRIKHIIQTEIFKYLVAGVLTTLVYMLSRFVLFSITQAATPSAILANTLAIVFAFVINDRFVFNQEKQHRLKRFVQFFSARLLTLVLDSALAFIFVEKYPNIIGHFVNHNLTMVNTLETLISQVLILVFNYILSKFFIFKDKH